MVERRASESSLDYHKRLVNGKLVDKTLSDVDYTELSEYVYGKKYSSDVARRMMYGSLKTLEILEANQVAGIAGSDIIEEIDSARFELQKERQKLSDQRVALNKLIRERARQEELNEIIVSAINSGNIEPLEPIKSSADIFADRSPNDLMVSLNDIHFGARHDNYWGVYDSSVCRKMMADYLKRIIQIAKLHNSENCICWENGDAISGSIHRSIQVSNKENVIEQVIGVSELLSEFLAELSKHFKTVKFVSVSGNHSRVDPNKDTSLVEERMDDLIQWYLEARLQNFSNIHIGACERIDPTMYVVNVRGKDYCGVHGDFDYSDSKIQSLQTLTGRPLYAVLLGHLHHNKVDEVQGVKIVMAGSFLGMDDYCVKKRIFGRPEQMVMVCDENGIVCHYDITFSR